MFIQDKFLWEGNKVKQAIISALIVLVCGYLGCFLDLAGCIIATTAAATGCVVYALKGHK